MESGAHTQKEYTLTAKWGKAVRGGNDAGFQALPDVLLKYQQFLGLTSTDFNVLANILMHWWDKNELPFPRPCSIAGRMGVSTRTVERSIQRMQDHGLIKRLPSEEKKTNNGAITVRRYDLTGLRERLNELSS